MKTIEKTCYLYEDMLELKLEDTRDNYIVKNALGEIGSIYVSLEGIQIYAKHDTSDKIYTLRNKELLKEFESIFKTTEYNPLSGEYYIQLIDMIEDKTLENMGYNIIPQLEKDREDELDVIEQVNKKYNKRH